MPLTNTPVSVTATGMLVSNTNRDTRSSRSKQNNKMLAIPQLGNTIPQLGNTATTQSTSSHGTPPTSSISVTSTSALEFLIKNVAKDLSDKLENIRIDLQQQINSLRDSFHQMINENICAEISVLRETTAQQEERIDFLERQLHVNDVIVNGVPNSAGENLSDIFGALCGNLNIPTPEVHDIFRIKNPKNPDASIIIKLRSAQDKISVLKAVSSRNKSGRGLSLRDVGFDSTKGIFLHESLTRKNYLIFREAYRLKRSKRLSSVTTKRGIVYVKFSSNDILQPVNNITMLQHLAANINE